MRRTTVSDIRDNVHDLKIDRTTIWGNPFKVGEAGTRQECLQKYKEWIITQSSLLVKLKELQGKVLGCWCRNRKCHGEFLARLTDLVHGDW